MFESLRLVDRVWFSRHFVLKILKNRLAVPTIATTLLVIHCAILVWSATRHSPTLNEPAHLVAGVSQWQHGRFELYRVNPPLTRAIAALPVLAAGCETDWSSFREIPGARPVFDTGRQFVAANGERSLWLITLARCVCIPFSILGGYICFRWASELYGRSAGLLALTLWCFSPNIIAHGQLITPDASATALGVAASYLFWRWLKSPNWTQAVVTGLCLGLAELTKTTWIVLFGLWPATWILWRWTAGDETSSRQSQSRQAVQIALILLLALYVINLGYAFDRSFTPLRDFQFVSKSLTGFERDELPPDAEQWGNRFAHSWLGAVPVPVPKQYLLGLDVQKRDFENFNRPSYLRGQFQEKGWWYYYLYALGVKVPLGAWLLAFLALLFRITSDGRIVVLRDESVLLAPLFCVLIVVSSQTGFSHHMRYVLPIFPFAFIWTSHVIVFNLRKSWKRTLAIVVGLVWSIGSSLWVYPHSLSYFNELAGGPNNGHAHLLTSNVDWGQDLVYLKEWLDDHPEAQPFYLAYYGYYDPKDIGIEYELPPRRPPTDKNHSELPPIKPGWYSVSVNFLRGYPCKVPDGKGGWPHLSRDEMTYLREFQPVTQVGHSMYIYKIEAKEESGK